MNPGRTFLDVKCSCLKHALKSSVYVSIFGKTNRLAINNKIVLLPYASSEDAAVQI